MEAGIQKLVTSDQGVQALIATRMYPLILPDKPTLPAITYKLISRIEEQLLEGSSGIFVARLQIEAWAPTYGAAKAAAQAVYDAFGAFAEELNDGPATLSDGFVVSNLWLADTPADGFEPDSRLYFVSQDFKVLYTNPEVLS